MTAREWVLIVKRRITMISSSIWISLSKGNVEQAKLSLVGPNCEISSNICFVGLLEG
jgi:hypothetical protein